MCVHMNDYDCAFTLLGVTSTLQVFLFPISLNENKRLLLLLLLLLLKTLDGVLGKLAHFLRLIK
jgi:hypothetical protein